MATPESDIAVSLENVADSREQASDLSAVFGPLFCAFVIMSLGVKAFGWMRNATCLPFFGCNMGFFGYDAFTHFVGGATAAVGIVWLFRRHPTRDCFQTERWKNAVLVIALCAFIAIAWETLEFGYDWTRITLFHIDLFHPNQLSQASNADTMGDLVFGMIGSAVSTAALYLLECLHGTKDISHR